VPRLLIFACGEAEVDGDVIVARLVKLALRLLPGQVACMAASCRPRVTWSFASPHALVALPEPHVWVHTLVGAGLVVRGGDCCWKSGPKVDADTTAP
jgi:hypothetical protein